MYIIYLNTPKYVTCENVKQCTNKLHEALAQEWNNIILSSSTTSEPGWLKLIDGDKKYLCTNLSKMLYVYKNNGSGILHEIIRYIIEGSRNDQAM